ncbi:MAG: sigma-70 family RNA polymerase sigma factor [Planctomycetes bacterium]|nr:sigma-70 family RNA polymerase sigma factor [Planctomycetota bacterium]
MNSNKLGTVVDESIALEQEEVRRAQAGDADAFAVLVRSYQRRAVSVAYRLVGNIEDASDVSQDAFVRAFRCLDQLDDPARFGPWLMRIVSNQSLNFRRSRSIRAAASLDDVLGDPAEGRRPATGTKLASAADDSAGSLPAELHDAISVALATLPDKQRLALVLFSVEGMPQKEVAEVLDCSVELVKWNVFQARKKLKDLLEVYL